MFDTALEIDRIKKFISETYDYQCTVNNRKQVYIIIHPDSEIEQMVVAVLASKVIQKEFITIINVAYSVDRRASVAASVSQKIGCRVINFNMRKLFENLTGQRRDNRLKTGELLQKTEFSLNSMMSFIGQYICDVYDGFVIDGRCQSQWYLEGLPYMVNPNAWMNIFPFFDYTHSEVVGIGLELGCPENWFFSQADASLFERRNGLRYNMLDDYLRNLPTDISEKGKTVIEEKHRAALATLSGYTPQYVENSSNDGKEFFSLY